MFYGARPRAPGASLRHACPLKFACTQESTIPILAATPHLIAVRSLDINKPDTTAAALSGDIAGGTILMECCGAGSRTPLVRPICIGGCNSYPKLKGAQDGLPAARRVLAHNILFPPRLIAACRYEYAPDVITVHLDDSIPGRMQPMRANILAAIARSGAGPCRRLTTLGLATLDASGEPHQQRWDGRAPPPPCIADPPPRGFSSTRRRGNKIVDNELHEALVAPAPTSALHCPLPCLMPAGFLLDLRHYRCNRMPMPWMWRGKRNSEEIRSQIGCCFVTVSQSVEVEPLPPTAAPRVSAEALLVEAQVRALLSFVFDGIFTEDRQELDAASFAALDTHARAVQFPCGALPPPVSARAMDRTLSPSCASTHMGASMSASQVRALLSFVFDGIFTEDRQELDAASFAALDTHAHSSVCTRRSPPTRVRTCHGPHALAILRPHAHGHLHVAMTQRARRRGPHRLQPPASRMQSCS
ncbi:hypothetical protein GGX14DRAFT_571143 [Mycena pura]|uniref:Uncharacterized protein n=1 Tax=Mycena pura TaxID=153505 RepID=A0AAD6Y8C8_9AGAR|nr:hypothetical protein GGX14DRAFT_571143 [Mycena pura]